MATLDACSWNVCSDENDKPGAILLMQYTGADPGGGKGRGTNRLTG